MTTEQKGPVEAGSEESAPNGSAAPNQEDSVTPIQDASEQGGSTESGSAAEAVAPPASSPSEPASEPDPTAVSDAVPAAEAATTAPESEPTAVSDAVPAPEAAASALEATPQTTASDSEASSSSPPPDATASIDASSLREKMAARPTGERPIGSDDGGAPRPESASPGAPVEIPRDDGLDAALEAQISAAMNDDISAPVDTAPVAGVEAAAEGETPAVEEIGPGSELQGAVQQIHGDDVFIEAGVRSAVIVALKQFPEDKQPSVGDVLKVVVDSVDADGILRARIPQARHKAGGNWDALAVGQVVDCMVTGTNKGGLQVTVSSLQGFMPASQVDIGYVADLEVFVGQKLSAQVTEVNKKKRNLVVSRRMLLQAERASQQGDFWTALEVGQDHEGVVKTIKDYGAFVNLGPMDGFLHIGEMSWSRINHPNEVLQEGQTVQVQILRLDEERNRISLSMKQLIQNPWHSAVERYAPERIVQGKVTRIADFGAFVELEPGIEGLVHISELAWRRVGSVNEVLSMGEQRDFQVIDVDPKRKRVSLSVKALEKRPEPPAEERSAPKQERKSNPNLRGGTGGADGGGLFGNPSDFS